MTENIKPSNLCDVTLPAGWECARFRKLFSFGKGLSITKEDLVDEGVPVISYGQVHSKVNTGTAIHESLIRFVPESYLKTDKQALTQEGNFIFADTSEDLSGVGNCAFVNTTETLFAGYHSIIARPKDTNMYPKYFAYLFLTDIWRDQIRAKVMGVKVFSISQKLLRDTTVFIPPILEQKAIAKLLDTKCAKIDSVIADIEKQIETLQKYKKSLITEAITKGLDRSVPMKDSGIEWIGEIPECWKIIPLKYLFNLYAGGDVNEYDFSDEQTEKYKYPIYSNSLENHGLFGYTSKYRFSGKTFTVTGRGEVGKAVPRFDSYYPIVRLLACVPKNNANNEYYAYCVNSADVLGDQTAMAQLTTQKLGMLMVPLPSDDEQRRICDYLNSQCAKTDAVIDQKKEQLSMLLQYKKSLIYEYVTGKKRVTEVN